MRSARRRLSSYEIGGDDDLVLMGVTTDHLDRDFKTACEDAGISDEGKLLTPHSLRHGYGSKLIEEGSKLPYVSRALGHASEAMTARVYVHEFEAQRTEEDDRVAAMLEDYVS
jgi:integrase